MKKRILTWAAAWAAASTTWAVPPENGRVRDVVGPDLIRVTLRGRVETIQLIGLDASDYDRGGAELDALREKAIEYAAGLALGQTVRLEPDPRLKDRDDDGQLQRYAFLPSGQLLNSEMVTAGWVRTATRPYFSRIEDFQKLEAEARSAGRGIWRGSAPAAGVAQSPPRSVPGVQVTPTPAAAVKTPPPKPPVAMPPIATPPPRGGSTPGPASSPAPVSSPAPAAGPASGDRYCYNPTGKKFHLPGCKFLEPDQVCTGHEEAARNRLPCRTCRPPLPGAAAAPRAGAPPAASPAGPAGGDKFCVNPGGEAYHYPTCKFREPKAECLPLAEAARGHRPCRTCKPPAPPAGK